MSRAARRFREVVERAIDRHIERTPPDDCIQLWELREVFDRIMNSRSRQADELDSSRAERRALARSARL